MTSLAHRSGAEVVCSGSGGLAVKLRGKEGKPLTAMGEVGVSPPPVAPAWGPSAWMGWPADPHAGPAGQEVTG